ncbi:thiamine biosynthesis lipoprotein [Paenibacillus sp. 1_12]|uniref:FAD:protein FMN transferase n=1 Tax=Paenibacillus sp. 1_12 TaxID=1566278 RepID=UPI0008ED59D3|nr:FAD:protein FMN transferase [Paenibacillus sp. 1_12]SFL53696.1 thiamine biosynthesis lipoprotein [Paenibacillus sp. 1_12]
MKIKSVVRSIICMDTLITVKVVSAHSESFIHQSIDQVFDVFTFVESTCSRFDDNSEMRNLSRHVGSAVTVSPLLFEAIRFSLELAGMTNGIFDPTIGRLMEEKGFSRHYLNGRTPAPIPDSTHPASYTDVEIDENHRTIKLLKPLVLDLGAIAKGMAIDLAKRILDSFEGFIIDAGGDIFAGGVNENQQPWRIGIRHPLEKESTMGTLCISDMAVCTSGTYERIHIHNGMHHLIDPHKQATSEDLFSCTVVAPYAMLADGASTAAFLLGQEQGRKWLEDAELQGLWITSSLQIVTTNDMKRYGYE